ncbi:hypothetical protein THAR02_11044 [Trichoderma harzianum]|uniref:Uncharacterized protein n=1 Tax=Trichoderma harzianum TaxID=5544 RepID=A0A0F9X7Q3_TRIHA|nr:hypothetical protein THAR02_11044 [Trichoderma harzianum]
MADLSLSLTPAKTKPAAAASLYDSSRAPRATSTYTTYPAHTYEAGTDSFFFLQPLPSTLARTVPNDPRLLEVDVSQQQLRSYIKNELQHNALGTGRLRTAQVL